MDKLKSPSQRNLRQKPSCSMPASEGQLRAGKLTGPKPGSSESMDSDLEKIGLITGESGEVIPRNPRPNANWVYVVVLCTLSVVISYADRTNISTAILSMQNDFNWDNSEKGIILSAFFLGYALTQIVGGYASDCIGGKNVLLAGISVWSLGTFITPFAAEGGLWVLVADRVMLGLGEGVAFPAIHSIISANVPVQYQSTVVAVATAASYAGTVFSFAVSPSLMDQFGWECVFYSFGAIALFWIPFWCRTTVHSSSNKATRAESSASLNDENFRGDHGEDHENENTGMWKSIPKNVCGLTSLFSTKPVVAICVAQYTQSWGLYVLINWLPTFFHDSYGVEVKSIGMYTVLPYVLQAVVGALCGMSADRLISRNWQVKKVRRTFQTIGMIGPAICMLLAVSPVTAGSVDMCSALITLGLTLSAFSLAGVSVSHLDVAPKNAGAVFGAGNTAATIAGLIGVSATGWLLDETHSWAWVFGITAGHFVIGAAVWLAWVGDRPLAEDKVLETTQ